MHFVRKSTLAIVVLLLSIVTTAELKAQVLTEGSVRLRCEYLHFIERQFITEHVNHSKFTSNLQARTVDQLIKSYDGSKMYLLKKDVKKIKKMMSKSFKQIQKKDCNAIRDVHELAKKRVAERVAFVKFYLGKDFKIDKKVKLVTDPDERKYPRTVTAQNRFHKKYLQLQVANYVSNDIALAKAKENVIRNYERIYKRIDDMTASRLYDTYLDAFARALDPHSSFLSADDFADFQINMRLELEGIGATLSSRDGFTTVEQLIRGGAAYRSGELKPKDKIVAVSQQDKKSKSKFVTSVNVIEMELRDVVKQIRGKKGTKVKLTILREDETSKKKKRFDVVLVRDKIKLEDEAASIEYLDRKVNGENKKIAVLNLPSFYADSSKSKGRSAAKDMKRLLAEAKTKNIDAMVLDLSMNGGGSLDDAVKIAGQFFKTGNVVKQSQKDLSKAAIPLADKDPKVDYAGPLVVLISRVSASASEIVSGTLKDYKRAVIVGGDHTFGKGSVQSVQYLPKGLGAWKTTVGMFFTAGGASTQHRGVTADIVFPSALSTDEIGEKNLDYSLPPKKLKSFLSKDAYVKAGEGQWKVIDRRLIAKLNKQSRKRIKNDEKFKEVKENIAKYKKRGKEIKISEIFDIDKKKEKEKEKAELDEGKDKLTGSLTKEQKLKKYFQRADVNEAINVAADMITLQGGNKLTLGATDNSKAKDKKN